MSTPVTTHRFTVDEYHRMGEVGIFQEDDRVELIDGQVVEMTPIGPAHAGCVNRLTALFASLVEGTATVSVQNPVILDEHHEPQPDVALLRYREDGYRTEHPRPADVLLLIEVADTSVGWERQVKLPVYARAGVPEVWLVDLPADRVEVHRGPAGDGYADVMTRARGAGLTPVRLPGVEVGVDRILG